MRKVLFWRFVIFSSLIFFISGCSTWQKKGSLRAGRICSKTQKVSTLKFIEAVPIVLLDEGWNLMLSVIVERLHPLEVFGGKGNKELGEIKVQSLIEYPKEDDLGLGNDAEQQLFLVGDLRSTGDPEKKIVLLEARYQIMLRSGDFLPKERYRRKFLVSFRGLTNCIYRIKEIDKEWIKIK